MEKVFKNEDYANFILEQIQNAERGSVVSAYMLGNACVDKFEPIDNLNFNKRCAMLAMAFDLMEHLTKEGFFTEEKGLYYAKEKVNNFKIEKVVENGDSFSFEVSEELEKGE